MNKRLADVADYLTEGASYRASGLVSFIGYSVSYDDCLIVISWFGGGTISIDTGPDAPAKLRNDNWLVGLDSFSRLEKV